MFRSTAQSLRSWWSEFSEDILGADLMDDHCVEPLAVGPLGAQLLRELRDGHAINLEPTIDRPTTEHAHTRTVGRHRPRRPGQIAPRAEVCLSPVSWTPAPAGPATVPCRKPARA